MECCNRPNRSGEHLSVEEEAKIEEKTRVYFDELAPKRHTKPQRSEYSPNYLDSNSLSSQIPEFIAFQKLETHSQKLVYNNGEQVAEEFVETEYYKDLNCIDKQHHTTGTGFIKMENTNDINFRLAPDTDTTIHASSKGNPATNDWIPASEDDILVDFASDKPSRSDN